MRGSTKSKRGLAVAIALALLAGPAMAAEPAPDGLVPVKSKRVDKAYVLPGADFRGYSAILLDPVEAGFAKNWLRDYNRDVTDLSRRMSDEDAQKLLAETQSGAAELFAKTFAKAGYRIADAPGPDVLRVRATLSDIRVNAPDTMSAGRSRSYAREAGSASLKLEAFDATSGKLLGRTVDSRDIGDNGRMMWERNAVTNRADFERAFTSWANAAVKALDELKTSGTAAAN